MHTDAAPPVNATLPPRRLEQACALEPIAEKLIAEAMDRTGLSARGVQRTLRVARTLAEIQYLVRSTLSISARDSVVAPRADPADRWIPARDALSYRSTTTRATRAPPAHDMRAK